VRGSLYFAPQIEGGHSPPVHLIDVILVSVAPQLEGAITTT